MTRTTPRPPVKTTCLDTGSARYIGPRCCFRRSSESWLSWSNSGMTRSGCRALLLAHVLPGSTIIGPWALSFYHHQWQKFQRSTQRPKSQRPMQWRRTILLARAASRPRVRNGQPFGLNYGLFTSIMSYVLQFCMPVINQLFRDISGKQRPLRF